MDFTLWYNFIMTKEVIKIKKYILLIVTILWISTIFYMSSKPGEESSKTSLKIVDVIVHELNLNEEQIDKVHFIVRKTAHFSEYFILSLLITLAYSECFNKKLNISFILLMCVLVALSDEYLQSFIPERGSMVRDVFIDFSGSLTQMILVLFIKKSKINRYKNRKNKISFRRV